MARHLPRAEAMNLPLCDAQAATDSRPSGCLTTIVTAEPGVSESVRRIASGPIESPEETKRLAVRHPARKAGVRVRRREQRACVRRVGVHADDCPMHDRLGAVHVRLRHGIDLEEEHVQVVGEHRAPLVLVAGRDARERAARAGHGERDRNRAGLPDVVMMLPTTTRGGDEEGRAG